MGEEWKNETDHDTFKTLNKEIGKIRDTNIKEQLDQEREYRERIARLEKQCNDLYNKNH